jgi:hypothetical protein
MTKKDRIKGYLQDKKDRGKVNFDNKRVKYKKNTEERLNSIIKG